MSNMSKTVEEQEPISNDKKKMKLNNKTDIVSVKAQILSQNMKNPFSTLNQVKLIVS